MSQHAIQPLDFEVTPDLSSVFAGIEFWELTQQAQESLSKGLRVDQSTRLQSHQPRPQCLQRQQGLRVRSISRGDVLISMHVADKTLVLGEACVQQPCIHPRLLDVPGTSSIGHVGLVFSKTKPTQFQGSLVFSKTLGIHVLSTKIKLKLLSHKMQVSC